MSEQRGKERERETHTLENVGMLHCNIRRGETYKSSGDITRVPLH